MQLFIVSHEVGGGEEGRGASAVFCHRQQKQKLVALSWSGRLLGWLAGWLALNLCREAANARESF